jgi:hypothetical protein
MVARIRNARHLCIVQLKEAKVGARPMSNLPQTDGNQREFIADAAGRTEIVDPPSPHDDSADIPEDSGNRPLFPSQQCAGLEKEWQGIQADFVDSPRNAVKQADALVTKTIDTLAGSFGDMRGSLEQTWEKNGEVSTEELRMAMQNYRSFFRRLLSI